MSRLSVLALAALALLLATAQAPAAARPAPDPSHASVVIRLKASDGFSARIENESSDDRVTLHVVGNRQYVDYEVHGEVSESRVEAQFGRLGRISVEFQPTRTVDSTAPPPRCEGAPWTTRKGFFAGTIEFRGERDYVEIDSTRTKGEMEVSPDWKCPEGRRAASRPASRDFTAEEEGDVATLTAKLPGQERVFAAFAVRDPLRRDYTYFVGGTLERREGMRITRLAGGGARSSSTFTFNHERGTAAVSPPWPFRGSARFRRKPDGSTSWAGSLRVPLLGIDPVALAGRRFEATLARDFPSD